MKQQVTKLQPCGCIFCKICKFADAETLTAHVQPRLSLSYSHVRRLWIFEEDNDQGQDQDLKQGYTHQ